LLWFERCQEGVHPLVSGEAPQALEAMQKVVLGGSDAPLAWRRVGASELREAKGALFEDGAHQQGKVRLLGRREKGGGSIDGVSDTVVPWQEWDLLWRMVAWWLHPIRGGSAPSIILVGMCQSLHPR
jgi:hypothetical protein